MISTRGRYALRVMIDLAEHAGGYTPMKEVAARQGISLKYLEQIMPALSKNGLVEGKAVKWCVAAGVLTSVAAAFLAARMDTDWLRRAFGVFLLYVGAKELLAKEKG